jgi:hypothetical protein
MVGRPPAWKSRAAEEAGAPARPGRAGSQGSQEGTLAGILRDAGMSAERLRELV